MPAGIDHSRTLLALLGRLAGRPADDHDDVLARCREAPGLHAEAGRFLTQFAERIGELSVEERNELYDATLAVIAPAVARVSNGSGADGGVLGTLAEALQGASRAPQAVSDRLLVEHVLPAIERTLPVLESARNPFALLLKSICFAVLDRLREPASPPAEA